MAGKIKIDNTLQKRFSYSSNKKSQKKEMTIYILIVCEGKKTEPNYFKGFPKRRGKFVYELKFKGENESEENMGGISPKKVVEKAIELRDNSYQKYDRVWAVFDKDEFEDFDAAILKAKSNNICCAWTNEAFELWYLLHFQNRITGMKRTEYQKAIEKEINKTWKNKKKPYKYAKNATDMYDVLQKYGNQEQAIKWAQQLTLQYNNEKFSTHNPRTQVFKLVKQLIGQDDKLNEEVMHGFE